MRRFLIIPTYFIFISSLLFFGQVISAQTTPNIDPSIIKGFKLRNLTPHNTGGRIADIAVDANNKSVWFAAVASGNVWRTKNAGTTWQPVFENYGSYSIGVVAVSYTHLTLPTTPYV